MTSYAVFLGFSVLCMLDSLMLISNVTGSIVWCLLAVISLAGMFASGKEELKK